MQKVKSSLNGKEVANLYGKTPTPEQAAALHFLLNESEIKNHVQEIRESFENEYLDNQGQPDSNPLYFPALTLCQFIDDLERISNGGTFD